MTAPCPLTGITNPLTPVPDPRPGQCVNDSRTLPDLTLNFIKTHALMDESVPSFFRQPILVRTNFHYRFTQIAVDPQIKTPGGKSYDVLFIGTDNGKVLKTVNAESAHSIQRVTPVVIEELQVFPQNVSVRNLQIVRTDAHPEGRLIVVSDFEVLSLRLHRCDKVNSGCSECVALQDPYCAWNTLSGKCKSVGATRWNDDKIFIQNIQHGVHTSCPSTGRKIDASSVGYSASLPKADITGGKHNGDGEVITITHEDGNNFIVPEVSAADSSALHYTVETMAMSVVAASLAALLVGFVSGYLCGRKCHKDEDDNLPYPDTEYEYFEQRQNVNLRMPAEPKLLPQEEVTYAEPVLVPPNKTMNSPKATLRKNENLFQFSENYNPPYARPNRDHFGTLRSQRDASKTDCGGMGYRDGFGTTRSVKKVYL
ncbi:semaphorin-1A [Halyomorpha halys]|uniref:semaphorin-1A n=1 Tax=Halyomorpha halys TaxID=286706 RepID=UPI000D0C9190|nr:semaphorin-1A-like [Halyomorpha halys]